MAAGDTTAAAIPRSRSFGAGPGEGYARLTSERIGMTQGARLEGVKHEGIGRNRGERSWSWGFAQCGSATSNGNSGSREGGADGGSEKNGGGPHEVSKASTAKGRCQASGEGTVRSEASGGEIGGRQARGQASRDCVGAERSTEGTGRPGGRAADEATGGAAWSGGGSDAPGVLAFAGSPTGHARPPAAQAAGQGRDLCRG